MSEIKRKKIYKKVPFWISWIMLLVLCVVCVFLTTWLKNNTKEYMPKDKFIRYSMGSKIIYDEELVLKRDDDITYIEAEGRIQSDGSPLVYEGQYKYLLPINMAFLDPSSDDGVKRVNYFSTTLWDMDKKAVTISYNEKEKDIESGFLYDGEGTFIFIDEVEISIGNLKYNLSPMSYVRIFHKDSIEVVDLIKDEYQYIELGDNEVVVSSKTDYSIDLDTNVMTVDDAPRILFSNIDAMGVLE